MITIKQIIGGDCTYIVEVLLSELWLYFMEVGYNNTRMHILNPEINTKKHKMRQML